jgi:hypothetical protein
LIQTGPNINYGYKMDKRGYYLLKNWIPVSRNQTPNPDSKQTTQV